LREGDIARGVPVTPKLGQLRFEEAALDVINDYRTNGKRSLKGPATTDHQASRTILWWVTNGEHHDFGQSSVHRETTE